MQGYDGTNYYQAHLVFTNVVGANVRSPGATLNIITNPATGYPTLGSSEACQGARNLILGNYLGPARGAFTWAFVSGRRCRLRLPTAAPPASQGLCRDEPRARGPRIMRSLPRPAFDDVPNSRFD